MYFRNEFAICFVNKMLRFFDKQTYFVVVSPIGVNPLELSLEDMEEVDPTFSGKELCLCNSSTLSSLFAVEGDLVSGLEGERDLCSISWRRGVHSLGNCFVFNLFIS